MINSLWIIRSGLRGCGANKDQPWGSVVGRCDEACATTLVVYEQAGCVRYLWNQTVAAMGKVHISAHMSAHMSTHMSMHT